MTTKTETKDQYVATVKETLTMSADLDLSLYSEALHEPQKERHRAGFRYAISPLLPLGACLVSIGEQWLDNNRNAVPATHPNAIIYQLTATIEILRGGDSEH